MKNLHKIRERSLQQILVDENLISREHLDSALEENQATGELLIQVILQNDYVNDMNLSKALVKNYQLPFLYPSDYKINKDTRELLAPTFLHNKLVYPLDQFGEVLVLVSAGNLDEKIIKEIEEITGLETAFFLAPYQQVLNILNEEFPLDEITSELNDRMDELFGMN